MLASCGSLLFRLFERGRIWRSSCRSLDQCSVLRVRGVVLLGLRSYDAVYPPKCLQVFVTDSE